MKRRRGHWSILVRRVQTWPGDRRPPRYGLYITSLIPGLCNSLTVTTQEAPDAVRVFEAAARRLTKGAR